MRGRPSMAEWQCCLRYMLWHTDWGIVTNWYLVTYPLHYTDRQEHSIDMRIIVAWWQSPAYWSSKGFTTGLWHRSFCTVCFHHTGQWKLSYIAWWRSFCKRTFFFTILNTDRQENSYRICRRSFCKRTFFFTILINKNSPTGFVDDHFANVHFFF